MNKNSKILITGANGMVGKVLSIELQRAGFKKLILVNHGNLNLIDRKKTIKFFKRKRPDYVFHIAAKVGGIQDNMKRPVEFLRDNILINTNVIDAAFACNAKKLINLSSATIYSNKIDLPSENDLFKEKLEEGNEAYALSKLIGLKLCEYYNKEYGTNFITLASSNIYGEYAKFDPNKSNVVAALIMRFHEAKKNSYEEVVVWGSGKAKREFVYARDLARIMISSMTKLNAKDTQNGLLNCGFNDEFSIKELAETISKTIGFQGKIVFDKTKPEGVKRRVLNSDKFQELVKLKNKTSLKNGLKNTYKYFLNLKK